MCNVQAAEVVTHLWHVAHVTAGYLMTLRSRGLPQYSHVTAGQIKPAEDAAQESGLATPTGAQQTIAVCGEVGERVHAV